MISCEKWTVWPCEKNQTNILFNRYFYFKNKFILMYDELKIVSNRL